MCDSECECISAVVGFVGLTYDIFGCICALQKPCRHTYEHVLFFSRLHLCHMETPQSRLQILNIQCRIPTGDILIHVGN